MHIVVAFILRHTPTQIKMMVFKNSRKCLRKVLIILSIGLFPNQLPLRAGLDDKQKRPLCRLFSTDINRSRSRNDVVKIPLLIIQHPIHPCPPGTINIDEMKIAQQLPLFTIPQTKNLIPQTAGSCSGSDNAPVNRISHHSIPHRSGRSALPF